MMSSFSTRYFLTLIMFSTTSVKSQNISMNNSLDQYLGDNGTDNWSYEITDEWYNSSTKDHPIQTLPKDDRWWLVWVQMSCLTLAAFGIMAKMLGKCRSCCKTCLDATCCRSDILSEMPRTSLPCNQCGELLRIWPPNMGPNYFRCHEIQCWSKGVLIYNNGTNRFNCFTCDLDRCRECGKDATMADTKGQSTK